MVLLDGMLGVFCLLVDDGCTAEELTELISVESALQELADLFEEGLAIKSLIIAMISYLEIVVGDFLFVKVPDFELFASCKRLGLLLGKLRNVSGLLVVICSLSHPPAEGGIRLLTILLDVSTCTSVVVQQSSASLVATADDHLTSNGVHVHTSFPSKSTLTTRAKKFLASLNLLDFSTERCCTATELCLKMSVQCCFMGENIPLSPTLSFNQIISSIRVNSVAKE